MLVGHHVDYFSQITHSTLISRQVFIKLARNRKRIWKNKYLSNGRLDAIRFHSYIRSKHFNRKSSLNASRIWFHHEIIVSLRLRFFFILLFVIEILEK
jgi:hypothetical protein